MIAMKEGVSVCGVKPEIIMALVVASMIYERHSESLVVTSLTDGSHSRLSYHRAGYAADLRLPAKGKTNTIARSIQSALGREYDVVVESDHIHIEYDVRKASHG